MKVALVTGSARGMGYCIANSLKINNYTVVYADIAKKPDTLSNDDFYIEANIAKDKDRKMMIKAVKEKYGRLDVLVNNAGVAPKERNDLLDMSEESFDRVIGINLKGTLFLSQEAAKQMIMDKKRLDDYNPRIINISSISADTSSTSRGQYCISKAGISMTTMLFADRLADEGIVVFEVRPGIIETHMTETVHDKYDKLIQDGLLPIKKFGKPQDVANVVLAACSGLLDYTSGQILYADGGFHIRRL